MREGHPSPRAQAAVPRGPGFTRRRGDGAPGRRPAIVAGGAPACSAPANGLALCPPAAPWPHREPGAGASAVTTRTRIPTREDFRARGLASAWFGPEQSFSDVCPAGTGRSQGTERASASVVLALAPAPVQRGDDALIYAAVAAEGEPGPPAGPMGRGPPPCVWLSLNTVNTGTAHGLSSPAAKATRMKAMARLQPE